MNPFQAYRPFACATLLLATCLLSGCGDHGAKKAIAQEVKQIQGHWKAVGVWSGGLEVMNPPQQYLSFSGRKVTFWQQDGERWEKQRGSYELDPKAVPKQIDITGEFQLFGIYSLDAESLTICSSNVGRPTQFSTQPGVDGVFLVRYERATQSPEKL